MKKILFVLLKTLSSVVLFALLCVLATSVSLVYNFDEPAPFSGEDIFNPYRNIDTAYCWKRANFHTHTKVDGLLNECDYWPEQVYDELKKFDYDIVTFSNHNALTNHPIDSELQVDLYEHGYNLFKFHKLVFGSDEVNYFDHLLPIFPSQQQFQIDMLADDSDIIVLNHPLRTTALNKRALQRLRGYDIIELDSGKSTENEYWDWALSAGIYSFALANDDLHYPDRSHAIAVRCNFVCTPSAKYEDVKNALLDGCYYSMRIPDYGNGDWQTKIARNKTIPFVKNIGLQDSTVYITLSQQADSIKVIGQNHTTRAKVTNSTTAHYTMTINDPYTRFTAYFPDGEVIYSNAFARYDASVASSPFKVQNHSVSILFTILFNLALLLIFVGVITTLYKIVFVW